MKQHPRRRSKRRTPAPTLHDLLRQPDADFYRLPDLEIRSGRIVTDGCRRVLDFAPEDHTGCGQHGYYILWHCAANRIAERQTADGCRAGGPH